VTLKARTRLPFLLPPCRSRRRFARPFPRARRARPPLPRRCRPGPLARLPPPRLPRSGSPLRPRRLARVRQTIALRTRAPRPRCPRPPYSCSRRPLRSRILALASPYPDGSGGLKKRKAMTPSSKSSPAWVLRAALLLLSLQLVLANKWISARTIRAPATGRRSSNNNPNPTFPSWPGHRHAVLAGRFPCSLSGFRRPARCLRVS